RALLSEGISVDPLPFVVLLVASVFLVGFLSTWAVVRWRNPWVALVPGGFVLLTNISYLPGQPSFSFILFILAAVLLVTRLTFMQALLRWRRRGVRPTDGMSIEVLGVGVVVALVLIAAAWTIPTANNWGPVSDAWTRALAPVTTRVDQLGQLFVGVGSKKPIPIHSFGAALPLQGKVVLDREVLYHVVAPEEMNLRGAVYDTYTGAGWRLSSAAAATLLGTTIEAAELGTPATRAQLRETTRAEVTVVSDGAPVNALLTGGDPLATDVNARLLLDATDRPITLVPDGSPDAYITVGTVSAAAIDTLREAGTDYPDALFARYTTLPGDLPSDVRALTETIVAGAETPYDAARLVETHLRQNYAFEYEIQAAPPGRDAVDYFLFESHHGYFDQFATAMAVMLRSVGIPARVAAGFALDDRDLDAATKAYTVTEERAWAWPEVYFPDLGWVEFNPTPARGVVAPP
ncbi:MAG: transglutaminase-like domain-containing protein, partial [Dehalococcoidia bacterium]